ncbi:MAG: PQQ-binding-like beta-propeller repeat protein [Deltaproteobacteria bacterium]|nr:PQQ-binding-like beta-propeller repeat protein [Deltaproteobacteria bacterium]
MIVGDALYFGNAKGDVFALHRQSSYPLWHAHLPGAIDGALAYGRSKIFAGDSQGNLVAIGAHNGGELWRFKIQAEWLAAPVSVRDRLFVASSNDELYALSEKGKELWHYSQKGDEKMTIRGTASPAVFGTEVFQGFSNGFLVALSVADGKELWKKRLRSKDRFYDIDMLPYVDEKNVIVATFDGNVFCLDRTTGNTNWVFHAGSYGGFLVEQDIVYFAGLDGNVYALKRSTGEVVWKTPFGKGVGLTPARAGDYLVVTTSGDPVYVIDPKNGKIVWTTHLGAGSFAAAVGHPDGWFYCISNYGNLHSFQIMPSVTVRTGPQTLPQPQALHRYLVEPDTNQNPS